MASKKKVTFQMASLGNTSYLRSLTMTVAGSVRQRGRSMVGSSYLLRIVKCFSLQRMAASTLIQSMFHFLGETDSSSTSRSYFMWLLSCLQSMIYFDSYIGNKASFNVVFGDGKKEGVIVKYLQNNGLKSCSLGINFKEVMLGAKNHILDMKRDLKLIATKVGAHNNGVNFALKEKIGADGVKILWPIDSNYKIGTEFMMFLEWNGGIFPTTTKDWIQFIKRNVIPPFLEVARGPLGNDLDENGHSYYDYSIADLKKGL